jgi:hypothetical protein
MVSKIHSSARQSYWVKDPVTGYLRTSYRSALILNCCCSDPSRRYTSPSKGPLPSFTKVTKFELFNNQYWYQNWWSSIHSSNTPMNVQPKTFHGRPVETCSNAHKRESLHKGNTTQCFSIDVYALPREFRRGRCLSLIAEGVRGWFQRGCVIEHRGFNWGS